jgi:hypothetical protein
MKTDTNYIKQVENQNYDLMVKLAQVEEMLEDFRVHQKDNENYMMYVMIDCFGVIINLANTVHGLKKQLEYHNISDNYFLESNSASGLSYLKSVLESICGGYNGNNAVPTESYNIFLEYIQKHLNKL